jgi:hypothetical protein
MIESIWGEIVVTCRKPIRLFHPLKIDLYNISVEELNMDLFCLLLENRTFPKGSARVQAYSPDPDYEQKVEHLCAVLREASHAPGERVVVFVDQMGYGSFPQAASDWMPEAPTPVRVAERFGSR